MHEHVKHIVNVVFLGIVCTVILCCYSRVRSCSAFYQGVSFIFSRFKQHQQHPDTTASQNLKKLLKYCEDIYIYYKLAYEHKFFDVANMLLQDNKTSCYLNDKLASQIKSKSYCGEEDAVLRINDLVLPIEFQCKTVCGHTFTFCVHQLTW